MDPRIYQMVAAKGAIKLEAAGLNHSSGRSVRRHWAIHFSMPAKSPAVAVIARIQQEIDNKLAESQKVAL